jgi:hypothetical protein
MSKLLLNFINNPTHENALKVVKHANKHPMSICLLTEQENRLYKNAIAMTKG